MKKFLRVIVLISLICLTGPLGSYAEEPIDTVQGYLEALKKGDTLVLKSYMGGRLYEKRKVLLEENTQYPEFLREFYERVQFQLGQTETDVNNPSNKVVVVEFLFPGGNKSTIQFVVTNDSTGAWKIVDEIEGSR